MQATATLRHVRISPRKVRLIARELPGRSFLQAESVLEFLPNKATQALLKLLRSAVANAENRGVGTKADLRVKEVAVNQGRTLKRFRPRSRGMMHPFARRSSHITIVLEGPGGVRGKQKPHTTQPAQKKQLLYGKIEGQKDASCLASADGSV